MHHSLLKQHRFRCKATCNASHHGASHESSCSDALGLHSPQQWSLHLRCMSIGCCPLRFLHLLGVNLHVQVLWLIHVPVCCPLLRFLQVHFLPLLGVNLHVQVDLQDGLNVQVDTEQVQEVQGAADQRPGLLLPSLLAPARGQPARSSALADSCPGLLLPALLAPARCQRARSSDLADPAQMPNDAMEDSNATGW